MKAWLEITRLTGTDRREVRALADNTAIGLAEGECPGCGAVPFHVQGGNMRIKDFETYIANGYSRCCGDRVGFITAKADTLFGLEEDRAVLQFGRARVY